MTDESYNLEITEQKIVLERNQEDVGTESEDND